MICDPNFLIVGAEKSGTTSLYHYLKQHPDVFMPKIKEPGFFVSSISKNVTSEDPSYNYITNVTRFTYDDYVKLFEDVNGEIAIGEASVPYLYYYDIAIPNIKKYLGDIKIIIILRNPPDRAFSSYTDLLAVGAESLSFEKCLEIEEERRKRNWYMGHFYQDLGFYYKQVKAYLENFSHVKIYLYDDLRKDTAGLVRNLYEFLGVDPSLVPQNIRVKYNVSGIPKFKPLQSFLIKYDHPLKNILRPLFLHTIGREKTENLVNHFKSKNRRKPKMKLETREHLVGQYRNDILMLEKLIKRDLSVWLR